MCWGVAIIITYQSASFFFFNVDVLVYNDNDQRNLYQNCKMKINTCRKYCGRFNTMRDHCPPTHQRWVVLSLAKVLTNIVWKEELLDFVFFYSKWSFELLQRFKQKDFDKRTLILSLYKLKISVFLI